MSLYHVDFLQLHIFGNIRSHHSCKTLHAGFVRMGIFVDDGHPKPFCALLVDIQYVNFYSLLAGS